MTGSAAHRPQPSRQPHPRHSREGWNPGGVSDSNTAPSNYTVIPAKAGIQTESRNKHRTLQPHRHSREGGNPDGAWKETPPSPPAPSFPRRWESKRSLGKQHRTLQPHRHSREGGNPDGAWKVTPPSPLLHRHSHEGWNPGGVSDSNTAPSNYTVIPAKAGIQTEPGKKHHPLPRHRHSHVGGNPGGVSQSNTALSNHTVIPAKAGIQTEPGKKHRPLLLPVIPNHFDLPQPSQAQAFSARYLIPSCRLSCTDCRNSSPQRLMSLCCTMANIDRTRDSRSALPRVNPT